MLTYSVFRLQIDLHGINPFWSNAPVYTVFTQNRCGSLIFWTVNAFHKHIVTTTYRYHSMPTHTYFLQRLLIQSQRYGTIYTSDWIDPDQTRIVVPSGSVCLSSGSVDTACGIKLTRSGWIQMASVDRLTEWLTDHSTGLGIPRIASRICVIIYRKLWLLSVCTYNVRLQRTMRLTKRGNYTGVHLHPSLTM